MKWPNGGHFNSFKRTYFTLQYYVHPPRDSWKKNEFSEIYA